MQKDGRDVVDGEFIPHLKRRESFAKHLENRNKARYDSHARITVEDADDVENLIKFLIGFLEQEIRRAKACSRE